MLITSFRFTLLIFIPLIYAASNKRSIILQDTTTQIEDVRFGETFSVNVTPPSSEEQPSLTKQNIMKTSNSSCTKEEQERTDSRPSVSSYPSPSFQQSAHPNLLSLRRKQHTLLPSPSPTEFFTIMDSGYVHANTNMTVNGTGLPLKRRVKRGEEVLRIERGAYDIVLRAPFNCIIISYICNRGEVVKETLLIRFLVVLTTEAAQKFSDYDLEFRIPKIPVALIEQRPATLPVPSSSSDAHPVFSPPDSPSSTATAVRTPSSSSLPQSRSSSLDSFDSISSSFIL